MHWLEVWEGAPGTGLRDRVQLVRLVRLCSGQHLKASLKRLLGGVQRWVSQDWPSGFVGWPWPGQVFSEARCERLREETGPGEDAGSIAT